MPRRPQHLEIPTTLLNAHKVFSKQIAADEISKHLAAHSRAYELYKAFKQVDKKQRRVPLPGTEQEVYLKKNKSWDGEPKFLHLFGVVEPEAGEQAARGIHLVTFSQVHHLAGVHYVKAPGVTLNESISESRQVALQSHTAEFQFVVNALGVMYDEAVGLGLPAA